MYEEFLPHSSQSFFLFIIVLRFTLRRVIYLKLIFVLCVDTPICMPNSCSAESGKSQALEVTSTWKASLGYSGGVCLRKEK